jgi:hypothetical protein
MVESWVVLGASGITAVAALGGSLIAIWVQGRREHQQWLRDRQAEVYAQVMRAHGQSLLDFGAMNAADPGTTAPDEIAKINAQAQLTIRQLMDGLTSLQVFGSNKVGELANDLGIKLSAHRNDLDNPEVGPSWQALALAIRQDLKIKDPPARWARDEPEPSTPEGEPTAR